VNVRDLVAAAAKWGYAAAILALFAVFAILDAQASLVRVQVGLH